MYDSSYPTDPFETKMMNKILLIHILGQDLNFLKCFIVCPNLFIDKNRLSLHIFTIRSYSFNVALVFKISKRFQDSKKGVYK